MTPNTPKLIATISLLLTIISAAWKLFVDQTNNYMTVTLNTSVILFTCLTLVYYLQYRMSLLESKLDEIKEE